MLVSEETASYTCHGQGVYRKCVGVSNPGYVVNTIYGKVFNFVATPYNRAGPFYSYKRRQ